MPPKPFIPLLALFLSLAPANGDNHRVFAGDYAVLTTSSEPARKAEKVAARFGSILLLDDGLGEFINLTSDQSERIVESLSKRLSNSSRSNDDPSSGRNIARNSSTSPSARLKANIACLSDSTTTCCK